MISSSLANVLRRCQSVLRNLCSVNFPIEFGRGRKRPARRHSSFQSCESLESRELLTLYDVGPGLAYTTIGAVPWNQLEAGDTVAIHWRETPYHELMLVSGQGTADAPIRIMGVAGPNGEKPVIDGENAVAGPNLDYAYQGTATRGLLTISLSSQDNWGYKPEYIEISGLEFRNAHVGNTFTRPGNVTSTFLSNAAGIFVERGEHITIRDCDINHNSNGLFVASGSGEELQSRDILVQGNYIHDNGNVGSDRQHNVYTEAIGITFEDNHLGPLVAGSGGINLKDRSAGLVVRNNWIEGGAMLLDLVDPEESWAITTADPRYQQTFVYGNVLIAKAGPGNPGNLIHYGGDTGDIEDYRQGTLYFYQNTVMIQGTRTGDHARWFTDVFRFDTNQQHADVRNNIFYCGLPPDAPVGTEVTGFGLFDDIAGTATFGVNWISPDWHAWRNDAVPPGSQITGTNNFITNPENDPGFVDLDGFDFHLLSSSNSVDQAGPLASATIGAQDVLNQYVVHQSHESRTVIGSASDLGAFEGPAPVGPGKIQFQATTASISEAAGIAHLTVKRLGGSTGAVSVDYTIQGLSAVSGVDFQAASGTLNFADGQSTAVIDITVLNNQASGPNKTLQIQLSNPTNGATLGTAKTLVITIQNDESQVAGPSSVQFSQKTQFALASAGQVVINVTRSGDLSAATTVQIHTKAGSAKAGKLFIQKSGPISFAAGQATQQITIQLINATVGKRAKFFKVCLESASQGAKVNPKAKMVRVNVADH